jgi:hypothetical protein
MLLLFSHIASNGTMVMNTYLKSVWKKIGRVLIDVLFHSLLTESEVKHDESQPSRSVSRAEVEPRTFRIQIWRVTAKLACSVQTSRAFHDMTAGYYFFPLPRVGVTLRRGSDGIFRFTACIHSTRNYK